MTLSGQCPSCDTQHDLKEGDVGHILECDCGAVLLACRASSFAVIRFRCHRCQAKLRVQSSTSHEQVRCGCGEVLPIPKVVLKRPIRVLEAGGSGGSSLRRLTDRETSSASGFDVVKMNEMIADQKEQEETAKPSELHGAKREPFSLGSDPLPSKPAEVVRRSDVGRVSGKRVAWGSWLSTTAVLILLIYSMVAFFGRQSGRKQIASDQDQPQATGAAENKSESSSTADDAIEDQLKRSGNFASVRKQTLPELAEDSESSLGRVEYAPSEVSDKEEEPVTLVLPVPIAYLAPKATAARQRVGIQPVKPPVGSLSRAVDLAFEAYQRTQDLVPATNAKRDSEQVEEYNTSLGETLGLIQHVHQRAVAEQEAEVTNTMRYLLTYPSYRAGHLPEAMVYDQSVVRWGDEEDPATLEAGMIALAAAQEACETQWGNSEELGELEQMRDLVSLIATRWPEDTQVNEMWMNLGYLYEAFNRPRQSISCYEQVRGDDAFRGRASIAAGLIAWRVSRNPDLDTVANASADIGGRQSSSNIASTVDWQKETRRRLSEGLELLEGSNKENKPAKPNLSKSSVEARLALAQSEFLAGNVSDSARWLRLSKSKRLEQILTLSPTQPDNEKVVVTESTMTQAFELLIAIARSEKKTEEAQQLLTRMAERVGSTGKQSEASKLDLLKEIFAQTLSGQTINEKQVQQARSLTDSVLSGISSVPTETLLWIAESWGQIGQRVQISQVAVVSCRRAADLYFKAIQRVDFPASSRVQAQRRRAELLVEAGELSEGLSVLNELLAKTPNVISLQVDSAEILQELAMQSGETADLEAAMKGPSGFSTIWGWQRLVTTLHSLRWSENATELHAYQLLKSQYHLSECRYLYVKRMTDKFASKRELALLERSVKTIVDTLKIENQWKPLFVELLDAIQRG